MRRVLLDTCAAIWFAEGRRFRTESMEVFEQGLAGRIQVFVSPITAWEMGLLVSRGRYNMAVDVPRWFDLLLEHGKFRLADMSPNILAKSAFLPGSINSDPADRIIVATAREHGCAVMTSDRNILDYAKQGHVQVIPS